MIQSMTAFARKQGYGEWGRAVWEIRTVNHRYLDSFFKIPDSFREVESHCRESLGKSLSRGKVECSLRFQAGTKQDLEIELNLPLIKSLAKSCDEIGKVLSPQIKQQLQINFFDFLQWPGVVASSETDYREIYKAVLDLFNQTVDELKEIRSREGAALKVVMEQRLQLMSQQVARARSLQKDVVNNNKAKLIKRFEELNLSLEANRLEQEIVLLSQKMDIAEELDRLDTHITEVFRILEEGGIIGRRLDFLMQELNREANTLGSKSVETEMTGIAVELKVLIEQIREQVQNVE